MIKVTVANPLRFNSRQSHFSRATGCVLFVLQHVRLKSEIAATMPIIIVQPWLRELNSEQGLDVTRRIVRHQSQIINFIAVVGPFERRVD